MVSTSNGRDVYASNISPQIGPLSVPRNYKQAGPEPCDSSHIHLEHVKWFGITPYLAVNGASGRR